MGAARRVGVMGGTFDPIHHGHLVAASEVAHRFELDEVVFVPTGQPWQKSERTVTGRGPLPDDGHRHRVRPAVLGQPGRHRPAAGRRTPSTRCATCARSTPTPEPRPVLHHRCRRARPDPDLARARPGVRPGALRRRDPARLRAPDGDLPEGAATLVEVPALAISSTDCRARVARGEPWYLVPDGVVAYATKRGLYSSEPTR